MMRVIEAEEPRARELQVSADLAMARQVHTLFAAMACAVFVVNAAGVIEDTNAAALAHFGLTSDEACGRPLVDVAWTICQQDGTELAPEQYPAMVALRTGQQQRNVIVGVTRADAQRLWLQVDAVPVLDQDGAVRQIVVSSIDITTHKLAEDVLRWQALHDALTGLPNRTLFYDRAEQVMRCAERFHAADGGSTIIDDTEDMGNTGGKVALLVMDLDRFKDVNDTLGHHYGDLLLQQVATRVQGALRGGDTVARFGGDEFAVLLPTTDTTGALEVAHAILDVLDAPVILKRRSVITRASIGIAVYPDHGCDVSALLQKADAAMYAAKRAGGGYQVVGRRKAIGDRRFR
jgi:diguanylate cyclase (GGDEF)-like protein/PAS domain S-box-containing protein